MSDKGFAQAKTGPLAFLLKTPPLSLNQNLRNYDFSNREIALVYRAFLDKYDLRTSQNAIYPLYGKSDLVVQASASERQYPPLYEINQRFGYQC